MNATSKFFSPLVVLLALSFVVISGCADSKKAIEAIERVKGEAKAAEPQNLRGLQRNPEAMAKAFSEAKEKLEAVSLSDCPGDFKNAFTEWRKSAVEALELNVEIANLAQSGDRDALMSKQQELAENIKQVQQAEAKLREVERKYTSK